MVKNVFFLQIIPLVANQEGRDAVGVGSCGVHSQRGTFSGGWGVIGLHSQDGSRGAFLGDRELGVH